MVKTEERIWDRYLRELQGSKRLELIFKRVGAPNAEARRYGNEIESVEPPSSIATKGMEMTTIHPSWRPISLVMISCF